MLVPEPVHAAIWHCLNHYAYKDATFMAERLFTEVGSDDSLHLLATCYYRSGKLSQAYDLLRKNDSKTPQNRFLLAKCCVDLERTHEAELAILTNVQNDGKLCDVNGEILQGFQDAACFALQLLAGIYAKTERGLKANDAEKSALKLNPLLWHSFEALCQRGDAPDPDMIFSTDKLEDFEHCLGSNHIINYVNSLAQPQTTLAPSRSHNIINAPAYSYGHSSTSTPIVPVASMHGLSVSGAQPVMVVTPVSDQFVPATPLDGSASDSCFSSSPAPHRLTMSGIGALNFSSDVDHSGNVTGPFTETKGIMPPPPVKPIKRVRASIIPFNDSGSMTPPMNEYKNSTERTFGRFPRAALVWSSNGKQDNVGSSTVGLQVARLDFSPLGVLSPCNPMLQTPKMGVSGPSDQQPSSSSIPLMNSINSDLKVKRSQNENNSPGPFKHTLFGQSSQNTPANNAVSGSVRRSSRLFGSSQQQSIKAKENAKTPAASKPTKSFKSPSKKNGKTGRLNVRNSSTDSATIEKNEKNKIMDMEMGSDRIIEGPPASMQDSDTMEQGRSLQKHSLDGLMYLLRKFAFAYIDLARYNCRSAVAKIEQIDHNHKNTAWVMGIAGKAYFEMGDYVNAKRCFSTLREIDPFRTDCMEYFSTALWHLQEEVDLSALAQDLTSADKLASQTWCAAGNCFSLQKEHENAIKFFQRAAQVNPNFAYSYTLLGHEYITIEELEKALSCFRTAVRIDPRHYNAWYGIGLVFYKQERYQLAEMYYRRAVDINPQSPILMCHLAVVQHALQKSDKALETLSLALKGSPKNPLCKFERASILFANERYNEALDELEELKNLVPKESPVYFLMGKVHNKLNNTHLALMHFSWAMDLDPKGANSQIKDALDRSMNKAAQENADHSCVASQGMADLPLLNEEDDDDEEMLQDRSGSS